MCRPILGPARQTIPVQLRGLFTRFLCGVQWPRHAGTFWLAQRRRMAARQEVALPKKRWSAGVTKHSDALDLEPGVFASNDPHKVALSLKHSAEDSDRRKSAPFRSAMSMLNFYLNRAGKNLPDRRRSVLIRAKDELRAVFGRNPKSPKS